jgi:hypothetical protein
VIQNLSRRLSKLSPPPEIFLNYSLDSKLSPKRGGLLWNLGITIHKPLKKKNNFCRRRRRAEALVGPAQLRNRAYVGK